MFSSETFKQMNIKNAKSGLKPATLSKLREKINKYKFEIYLDPSKYMKGLKFFDNDSIIDEFFSIVSEDKGAWQASSWLDITNEKDWEDFIAKAVRRCALADFNRHHFKDDVLYYKSEYDDGGF